jgi:predicted deacylase
MLEIFRHQAGHSEGPHLLIFGAIHGNEICGARALLELHQKLSAKEIELSRGRCTLVPICNPEAYRKGERFMEADLNRVFAPSSDPKTYEARLAQELIRLVDDCDVLLDLHSMRAQGEAFCFLNEDRAASRALCQALGPAVTMRGWPELYAKFPGKNNGDTQSYADFKNKTNALIECGSHHDGAAPTVALEACLRALAHLEMLGGHALETLPARAPEQRLYTLQEIYFREHEDDQFVRDWRNFDSLKPEQLIAVTHRSEPVRASLSGIIVFPSRSASIGSEWFYTAS